MKKPLVTAALILSVLSLAFALYTNFSDGGMLSEISGYQAQLSENADIRADADKQQAKVDKREGQIAEYEAELTAAEDEKTRKALNRAISERDKYAAARDKHLAKLDDRPTDETLLVSIEGIREGYALSRMKVALFVLIALVLLVLAYDAARGGLHGVTLAALALLAAAAGLITAAVYRSALGAATGQGLMAAGLISFAAGLALNCLAMNQMKLTVKNVIGAGLILLGGALIVSGYLANSAPDAAEHYINAMSPGLISILGGGIAAVIGVIATLNPLHTIRYDLRKNPMLMVMMIPSVVYFLICSYLPMAGVYFAFTSYQFSTSFFGSLFGSTFIGIENFRYLFASGTAWKLTFNTVVYNLIFIFVGTVLKIAIAIMFSEISGKRYKKAMQTITFLPHFISMVMVGTFAYSMLNYDTGIINSALRRLGFAQVDFYSKPSAWYAIIPIVEFWKSVGYGSIIYVSAITGISDELYEAADLDGASFMQQIRHITLPCLRPTIVILILMALGNIMRGSFDLFYQLVGRSGRLFDATEIIDTYVWRALRDDGGTQIGRGAAAGLYQSFVGMILVVTVNGIVKRVEPESSIF